MDQLPRSGRSAFPAPVRRDSRQPLAQLWARRCRFRGRPGGRDCWLEDCGANHVLQVLFDHGCEWAAQSPVAAGLLLPGPTRFDERVCDFIAGSAEQNPCWSRENQAWETTLSVMLTGEKNSYEGVRPRSAKEHVTGWRRFGAVELAARYSQLAIDGDAFPRFASVSSSAQMAKEQGIGLNWYLNRYVKLVTDFEHTNFTMAPGNKTPLHAENVLMNRIQLAF